MKDEEEVATREERIRQAVPYLSGKQLVEGLSVAQQQIGFEDAANGLTGLYHHLGLSPIFNKSNNEQHRLTASALEQEILKRLNA